MTWLRWLLVLLGIAALSALVWFAGPLLPIGESYPLEGIAIRAAIVGILFGIVFVVWLIRFLIRRRAAKRLEKAMVEAAEAETDAPVLNERMRDALATLKRTSRSRDFLYDLPWYLVIGPPGAGKTTALVNSGLKFPLARGSAPAEAIEGSGGTRYCDWWFTDEAVLVDTAGRYTTQDSDAALDRKSWLKFLDLLKANRPRQPINGVIVAISLEDVMAGDPAEVAGHGEAIRRRLAELHEELKIDFPVYVLFTKADLVAGFMEYFADLDENRRKMVWGATFNPKDRTANMVGEVAGEIDLLVERLSERMPERLQEEPDPRSRALLFGFPAQVAASRKAIVDFLQRIFEPTRYHASAALRGFYFTSGTQKGTPFDQVIGALQRSYGVESAASARYSGLGKSFFLHDLLSKVVFAEAGWVSTNLAAVRRAFALRTAGYAAVALITAGVLGAWWVSYSRNEALIEETDRAVASYRVAIAPLVEKTDLTDSDLRPVYERIQGILHLPAGYANRNAGTPVPETFGLSQRSRLTSAAESAYRAALENFFRPRLVLRLEQQLEANISNPAFVYDALKVYLMLGGKAPVDRELVVDWMRQDWEESLYPGAPFAPGRQALADHLVAMLDLDTTGQPLVTLNGPLVEEAQRTLARLSVADRAYALLKSAARGAALEDWAPAVRGGSDAALVFESADGAPLEDVRVPGFFTYNGFYTALLDPLPDIAQRVQEERWVLGAAGEQTAVAGQYETLLPDVLELYRKDFIAAWEAALSRLRLKPLVADKPRYIALSAASSVTSPIRQLIESVRDETTLTRERPDAAAEEGQGGPPGGALAGRLASKAASRLGTVGRIGRIGVQEALKSQQRAGETPIVPGAAIEAHFKPYHVLADGEPGRRPIDALVANLNEIYQSLSLAATNPAQAEQAVAALQVQVATLRANVSRLPQPVDAMVKTVADDIEGDATGTSVQQLSQALSNQVTGLCQQIVANRYPFVASERDVPLADFGRLFGPGGIMDKFFFTNLAPLVDTSGKTWSWRPDLRVTRDLSDAALRQFQVAAAIRDAFFSGGGTLPGFRFEVKPVTLSGAAQMAVLDLAGASVVAQHGVSPPIKAEWPPVGAAARTALFMLPELPDRRSSIERSGPWSLFRILDAGSTLKKGESISASFVIGGREVSFLFTTASLLNPLGLSAIREFRCPTGL